MGSCAAPSAKGDDKFITTDYLQQCRKNWLFADTRKGAEASAACYSLIETAKANNLEPQAYIKHILDHIATADTLGNFELLLPWNVKLD
jgi:transposase